MGLVPDSENVLVPPVGYLQQVDNIRSRQDSLISLDHNDSVLDIQGQSKSERTGPRAKSSVQSSLTSRKFFYHVFQAIKSHVDRQLPFHRRSPWGRATKAWPVLTSPF